MPSCDSPRCGYPRRRATAGVLNFVFTRVVNHCVIVVGLSGGPPSCRGGRAKPSGSLNRSLNVELEMPLGKKTNPVQYLTAIRPRLPRGHVHVGIKVSVTIRR